MIVGSKRFATLLVVVGLSGTTACQTDLATTPDAARLQPTARLTTYDASTRTLGVTIGNTYRFTADTYRTLTSSLVGGNGTYYYKWFIQPCFGTYCDDQYLWDEGWGMSSVNLHLTADMSWVKVSLEVFDSPDLPYSGSTGATIIGPAPQNTGANFKCELGFDDYPIHDYDPTTRTYIGYYRDGCTGARVYDPANPHTY